MPPRRVTKRGKPSRIPTQFGQLDTTPTSRQFQSIANPSAAKQPDHTEKLPTPLQSSNSNPTKLPDRPTGSSDEFEDDLDDVDLIQLDQSHGVPNAFTQRRETVWSETGSQTRRSSPAFAGDTPLSLWQFEDDSFSPFSDSRSSKLPDTMPLPPDPTLNAQTELPLQTQRRVDFSETATTDRRSSPLSYGDTLRETEWYLDEEPGVDMVPSADLDAGDERGEHQLHLKGPEPHFSIDEIYEATPMKVIKHRQAIRNSQLACLDAPEVSNAQHKTNNQPHKSAPKPQKRTIGELLESGLELEEEGSPILANNDAHENLHPEVAPQSTKEATSNGKSMKNSEMSSELKNTQRGKKRKQRAKTPLQFDETTQQLKEAPKQTKPAPPARMPLVSALRESAQPSSSPATSARKKVVPKTTRPRKQRKTMPSKEPPQKPAPSRSKVAPKSTVPQTRSRKNPAEKTTVLKPQQVTKENEIKDVRDAEIPKPARITVSSDSEESSFQPDSSLSPLDHPGTADTTMDDLPRGDKKTATQIYKQACHPKENHDTGAQPDLRLGEGEVEQVRAKIISSSIREETQTQKRSEGRKEQHKREPEKPMKNLVEARTLEKQSILIARNHNIQSKKPPINKEPICQKPGKEGPQTHPPPAQLAARGNGVNRHFSISVAGSPVPMGNDSPSLVDHSGSDEVSSEPAEVSASRRLDYGLLDTNREGKPRSQEFSGGPKTDSHPERRSRPGSNGQGAGNPIPTYTKRSKGQPISLSQPLPLLFANMNKDMHSQILAALQLHDTVHLEDNLAETESEGTHHKRNGTTQKSPQEVDNDVTEQLHGIVQTITEHLKSKEGTIRGGVRAYRSNGLSCVEKIESKFRDEKQLLKEASRKDSGLFIDHLDVARTSVGRNEQRRRSTENQLAEDLATRRQLYRKATMNLRAVYRRMLGESAINNA